MTMTDPFEAPSATSGGGTRPRLHQLASGLPKAVTRTFDPDPGDEDSQKVDIKTKGRLVIMRPVPGSLETPYNALAKKNTPRMSVDIVVLDGPPITEIIDGQTHETVTELDEDQVIHPGGENAKIPAMYVNGVVILQQLQGAYDSGGVVLGRLGRLPKKGENAVLYALLTVTDEERAMAIKWWQANNNPFDGGDEDD